MPSLRDVLAAGSVPQGLILLSALWCHYCAGITDNGAVIPPNDPDWPALQARAHLARKDPAEWLRMETVYGDLAGNATVVAAFSTHLRRVQTLGTKAVLAQFLQG